MAQLPPSDILLLKKLLFYLLFSYYTIILISVSVFETLIILVHFQFSHY